VIKVNLTGLGMPEFEALDSFVINHMSKAADTGSPTPAVTLAVAKDNRLVYARGYAQEGYEDVQPTSMFRIASCTKPLTQIAIYQLVEQNKLKLDQNVEAMLVLKMPNGQPPPEDPKPTSLNTPGHYFYAVTVRDLLRHQGGWRHDAADPTFVHDTDVVAAFNANGHPTALPVTKDQLASWGISQPQEFFPDSEPTNGNDYSNFGYLLLGLVIQKATGMAHYIDAMHKNVFAPLGITRPRLAQPAFNNRAPGEVRYYHLIENPGETTFHEDLRPSVLEPSQAQVPVQYGGENQANFDSFGGWVMAAPDYAKVLSAFTHTGPNPLLNHTPLSSMEGSWNWDGNQTQQNGIVINQHGGDMPGTETYIAVRSDHIGVVMLTNGDLPVDASQLNTLLSAIPASAWPQYDLFHSYLEMPVTSGLRYDGIWNPSAVAQEITYQYGLTDHIAAQKTRWDKGFRLLDQHAYVLNGQVYFDAIWTPSTDGQVVSFNETLDQHRATQKTWWDKGYRLTHQHAYVLDGQVYFGGLWSPSTTGQYVTYDSTLDQHRAFQKEFWDKGYRLTHQHVYVLNGQAYFGGLWSPSTAGQFVTYNATLDQHRAAQKEWWDKGYRLTHQHAYVLNGQAYFGGLWSPSTAAQFVSWGDLRDTFSAEYAVMWSQNMRLISLTNHLT